MKRVRFTEDQIIAVLREHEAGAKTADLARKHGISEATLYNWKAKYGGLDVSEARRLRALPPPTEFTENGIGDGGQVAAPAGRAVDRAQAGAALVRARQWIKRRNAPAITVNAQC